MQILLLILVAMLFVVVVLNNVSGDSKNSTTKTEEDSALPYVKKPYLMTNAEREFFFVLERAVQGRYHIVPQVELSKIVQVSKESRWKYKYNNKINLKSVDFVLFDKQYFTPQIVVELDDSFHRLPARKARDSFLDSVMKKVGIRVVHIRTGYNYDLKEVSATIGL